MDFKLENKKALVSGSSQGIGFAIAEALVKEGVNVIINGSNTDRVDKAVDKLKKVAPGIRISGAVADLSTAEGVQQLVENAPAVDILVNNVGFYTAKEFEEITDAEWDRIMDLNFMSGVRLSRAFLPGMRTHGWGRIVFISSESGVRIPREMIHYGVSKAHRSRLLAASPRRLPARRLRSTACWSVRRGRRGWKRLLARW